MAGRQIEWEIVERKIREAIESGTYRPGDALPSTRALAAQYNVSRGVIDRAMRSLVGDGLVDAQHGRARTVVGGGADSTTRLVLVGGYAGSGKTEFARIVARHTGWAILDKDTITRPVVEAALEALGLTFDDRESPGYVDTIRPREYEALLAAVDENLACGVDTIASAPFLTEFSDSAWMDRTRERVAAAGAEVTFVWLRTSPDSMHTYLRSRGAGRDRWKLAHWSDYLAGVDLDYTPAGEHVVVANDPDSLPLQQQARSLIAQLGHTTAAA